MDDTTPRLLCIAGDNVPVRDTAATLSDVSGARYRPLWAGSLGSLGLMIRIAKLVAPQPKAAFPPWQGVHYMRQRGARIGYLVLRSWAE